MTDPHKLLGSISAAILSWNVDDWDDLDWQEKTIYDPVYHTYRKVKIADLGRRKHRGSPTIIPKGGKK